MSDTTDKKEKKDTKNKKKIIALIVGIVVVVIVGLSLLAGWMVPKTVPIEESTIFSAEEVEVKCVAVVFALNMEDYEALQEDYADETMKEFLTKEQMDAAKSSLDVDWKANVSFGEATIVEITQMGKSYAVVQLPVGYGEKTVTYTLTFNPDYKLAGLYMK